MPLVSGPSAGAGKKTLTEDGCIDIDGDATANKGTVTAGTAVAQEAAAIPQIRDRVLRRRRGERLGQIDQGARARLLGNGNVTVARVLVGDGVAGALPCVGAAVCPRVDIVVRQCQTGR